MDGDPGGRTGRRSTHRFRAGIGGRRTPRVGIWLVAFLAVGTFGSGIFDTGRAASQSAIATLHGTALLKISSFSPSATLPPSFWGVDSRVYASLNVSDGALLNSTPVRYLRWPGGAVADSYNITDNRIYGLRGSYYSPPTNASEFVTWCRSVSCHAIVQLPAEIDRPATAAYYVRYLERTLAFHPAYYEIGNEPARWHHFGYDWLHWTATQRVSATPSTYAALVQSYVSAIHAVAPSAHIIGLPGVGTGGYTESKWIAASVGLNGPNLSAVAIHVYPAGGGSKSTATVLRFFDALRGHGSLDYRIPIDRKAILTACPSCSKIQVLVTEFGSGTSGGPYDRLMNQFGVVPFLATEVIQGATLNITNQDLFCFQGTYPGSLLDSAGNPTNASMLYSQIFPHVYPGIIASKLRYGGSSLHALVTLSTDKSSYSLLVVNDNTTRTKLLDLTGSKLPSGAGVAYSWDASVGHPIKTSYTKATPSSWALLPESLLLIVLSASASTHFAKNHPLPLTGHGLDDESSWSGSMVPASTGAPSVFARTHRLRDP